jgi:amidase
MVSIIVPAEFKVQINDYLKTLAPKYPKTLAELVERNASYVSMGNDGAGPNPTRWRLLRDRDLPAMPLTDPSYIAMTQHFMPMTVSLLNGILAKDKLDAIIYPTGMRRAGLIAGGGAGGGDSRPSPTGIANLSGFPDLIVPAGFTTDDLPVTVSFFGTAFSEPKLLALGYSFEQATKALRRPVNTPALAGTTIEVPDRMAAAK